MYKKTRRMIKWLKEAFIPPIQIGFPVMQTAQSSFCERRIQWWFEVHDDVSDALVVSIGQSILIEITTSLFTILVILSKFSSWSLLFDRQDTRLLFLAICTIIHEHRNSKWSFTFIHPAFIPMQRSSCWIHIPNLVLLEQSISQKIHHSKPTQFAHQDHHE